MVKQNVFLGSTESDKTLSSSKLKINDKDVNKPKR